MIHSDEIQYKAYMHDHRDGLIDIFAGIMILSFGIGMFTEMAWMAGAWVPIFLPLWSSAKKNITGRRLDQAEMSDAQRSRAKLTLLLVTSLVLGAMLLVVLFALVLSTGDSASGLRTWLQEYFPLACGIVGALLLGMVALIVRAPRFWIYATLTLALLATGPSVGISLQWAMTLLGCLVTLAGFAVLTRFVGEYPVLE